MAAVETRVQQRVLVIEDERTMARLVCRALAAAGFGVSSAESGLRGLELIRNSAFGLVILDLMLPDTDGLTVLTSAAELSPTVPILVLSAVSDTRSKVMCLELGACDYVAKPFELAELVARVRARLRDAAQQARPRFVRNGSYVLDLRTRTVCRDKRTVGLTTREFVLLEYLMTHNGTACTRDELLEHVWGYAFDPGTNVVDVCVGRLRHKLGASCINTIRNVGYGFVGA